MYDLLVIGGGAAGIFGAIWAKTNRPEARVAVFEKTATLLAKVRISGGGRCNVTHACFDPRVLAQNYPRGGKELIGPFHRFQPKDTIDWFEARGVQLKTEADGRVFPVTDQSETIIACLLEEAKKLGVEIHMQQKIQDIAKLDDYFEVTTKNEVVQCKRLLLATGSNHEGYTWAEKFSHTTQKPVPSLFTFNVPSSPLKELSGISVQKVEIRLQDAGFSQTGPLLITHFGFSGPAVLKLSAWAARALHEKAYRTELIINWLPDLKLRDVQEKLLRLKAYSPQKTLATENIFSFPKSLWKKWVDDKRIVDIPNRTLELLAQKLHDDVYLIEGKTTNKEEFVTAGGVTLKEINFKTMESRLCPGLFFAGEILDIDGVTGGFNFQNAWTGGFLAGSTLADA